MLRKYAQHNTTNQSIVFLKGKCFSFLFLLGYKAETGEGCGREWEMMGVLGEFLEEVTSIYKNSSATATATIGKPNKNFFLNTYKGIRGENFPSRGFSVEAGGRRNSAGCQDE